MGALNSNASFARQNVETEPPMLASCDRKKEGGSECVLGNRKVTLTGELIHISNVGSSIKTKRISGVGKVLSWTIDKKNAYLFNNQNELTIFPIEGEDTEKKIVDIIGFNIVENDIKLAVYGRFVVLASKDIVAKVDLVANDVKIRKLELMDNSGFKIDSAGSLTYCGVCVCRKTELGIIKDKKGS